MKAQEFSISIDAEKDTWYEQLTGPEDGLIYLPAACYLPDIGSGPDGDDDLSAFVWMAYDEDSLYLYTEVTDDIVNGSSSSRWLNDCLELKFDPEPSEGGTYDGRSNCRLTALGDGPGVDNLNGSSGLIDDSGDSYVPSENDYARRLTDDGYALEFRIPIEYICTNDGRSLLYNETGKFGLAINVGDNDTGTRDNMLQWSAGHADAVHTDPSLLGTVTFLENNKLGFEAVSTVDPSIINENAEEWYSNPNVRIKDNPLIAERYDLITNYPNPFNPETTIRFQIKNAGNITLAVYNINGDLVNLLVNDRSYLQGTFELTWNGRNDNGKKVSSGVYFCRLMTETHVLSNKMMLVR